MGEYRAMIRRLFALAALPWALFWVYLGLAARGASDGFSESAILIGLAPYIAIAIAPRLGHWIQSGH